MTSLVFQASLERDEPLKIEQIPPQAGTSSGEADQFGTREDVLQSFQRYTQAFQALDALAVVRARDEKRRRLAYATITAEMPLDYARTEVGLMSVHRLLD